MTMATLQMVFVGLESCLILVYVYLALFGPRKITAPGVVVVLRYGSFLRILAVTIAWGAPGIAIYALWNFPWRTDSMLITAGVTFLIASIVPGLLLLEVERMQIAVTEDALIRQSPWTGKCVVKWSEVERVGFSTVNRWFVISGEAHTVRVSRHLTGVREFVQVVKRKLAVERYSGAAAALEACS
jgi:hypothetical protein